VTTTNQQHRPVGELLRRWRENRRLSQLELAVQADVSSRHLSFLETGRSAPGRDMILHLAERLEVPMRERNRLLLAAGFAPVYSESSLDAPQMSALRQAMQQIIDGHEPYPAAVVDGDWNLVVANRGLELFTSMAAPELLVPPVNALRLTLHPRGMAPRIVNLAEWREHLLRRLRRRIEVNANDRLVGLYQELSAYPSEDRGPADAHGIGDYVIPLRVRDAGRELAFFCTTTVFGTPQDITVAELAIEQFFPADADTGAALRRGRQGAGAVG